MTDPTNGSVTVEAPKLGGGAVSMKKLSPSDFVTLANRLTKERRESIVQNAKDAGTDPKELAAALNAFDARPVTRVDVVTAAQLPAIQAEIFRLSLVRAKPEATDADVDALELDLSDAYRLALSLLHIDVAAKPAAKDRKEGDRPLSAAGSEASPGSEIPSRNSSPKQTESEPVAV